MSNFRKMAVRKKIRLETINKLYFYSFEARDLEISNFRKILKFPDFMDNNIFHIIITVFVKSQNN